MTVDVRAGAGGRGWALEGRRVVAEGGGEGGVVDLARYPDAAVTVGGDVGRAARMTSDAAGRLCRRIHVGPVIPRKTTGADVTVCAVDGPVISRARGTVAAVAFHGPLGRAGQRQDKSKQ